MEGRLYNYKKKTVVAILDLATIMCCFHLVIIILKKSTIVINKNCITRITLIHLFHHWYNFTPKSRKNLVIFPRYILKV